MLRLEIFCNHKLPGSKFFSNFDAFDGFFILRFNEMLWDFFLFESEATENPFGEDDSKSPFPVQPQVKRSYAQNITVWIKASGLQVQRDQSLEAFQLCLSCL